MANGVGQTVFATAGSAIGGYFGGPIGGAIGGMIGSFVGGLLFNRYPKPAIPYLQGMNAAYGQPISIVFGDAILPGNFAWLSEPVTHSHTVGKGGPGAKHPQSGTVHFDAQLIFCEAPNGNARLLKLYLDGKIYTDNSAGVNFFPVGIPKGVLRVYSGAEDQLPDWLYGVWAAKNVAGGSDYCPAYRGLASIVFQGFDTTDYGARFPQVTAAWHVSDRPVVNHFTRLDRFEDDTSSRRLYSLTVDWYRSICYTLADDQTLRAYDMATHTCIMQKLHAPVGGITGGLGTYLVGFSDSGVGLTGQLQFRKIDPDTLQSGAPCTYTDFNGHNLPGEWFVSLAGFVVGVFGQGGGVFCATIQEGQTGPHDRVGMSLGRVPFGTYFSASHICQGSFDAITLEEDIWVLNYDNTDGARMFLLRFQSMSDGFDLQMDTVRVFQPSDFGGSEIAATAGIVYDPSDDSIVFEGVNWNGVGSFKYRWKVDQIVWESGGSGGASNATAGTIQDLTLGTVTTSTLPDNWPGTGGAASYIAGSNTVVWQGNDQEIYIGFLQRTPSGGYLVADIISYLLERVGLASDAYDVSLITQTTTGYVVKDIRSAGSAIHDICQTFLIDMIESDFKLKFIPRGQPEILTIPQADLISTDTNDNAKFWVAHRPQEAEMPLTVVLRYSDQNLDYQMGSAQSQRTALPVPTVFSKRRQVTDLSITTDNPTARQIAEKWLYTMWAERMTFNGAVGMKYLHLDPADNVAVALDNGKTYHVRLAETELGTNWQINLLSSTEAANTYRGTNTPGAVVSFTNQTVKQSPFGHPLLFNVPLLQDSDEIDAGSMRIYMAAGSAASTWLAGGMYVSADGATYTLLADLPQAANWGYTRHKLAGTVAAFATDRRNTLSVAFTNGSTVPGSCTYTDMMNGANAALVGSEIIQFQNVTENADGTYTLDTLLRGRRGTEWAVNGHADGETLVMLAPGQIVGAREAISLINTPEYFRLLPSGRFMDQANVTTFAYKGYDKYPYAPVALARAVSGSDLALSWVRRTRIGGLLVDGSDTVPLSEATEAYEAYVLLTPTAINTFNPATPATYTRKFSALTTPAVTYTASQMATDGFTPATDTLYLVVYQISAVVGRGFQAYRILPPP